MKKFQLPECVAASRKERLRSMVGAGKRGIVIRVLVVVAEIVGYALFASSSLLLDAIASLVDIAASLSLLFFIRIAAKPPDEDHPLGHGRYEPIAGLQLALFLILIGGGLFFQQFSALVRPAYRPPIQPLAWLIPLAAVILLEIAYRHVHRAAKKEQSPALLSEAFHYRIDAISSLVATAALALGALFPHFSHVFDHTGALSISLIMIVLGGFAARKNIHQLMDRIPDQKYFDLVRAAALRVQGVKETEKLRIQRYGPDAHISIDIEVAPELSVMEAHTLTQLVRIEIQKSFPEARDVIVHVEPYLTPGHPGES